MRVDDGVNKVRLFVGVRISVAAAEAIAKAAERLREASATQGLKPRWVMPTNYHITLKFLGWVHAPLIGALDDSIGEALADAEGFEIESAGIGAFPKPERARILWAGARDPAGRLADLAERVDRAAVKLGFEPEARAFHPHVTIARLKQPGDVGGLLEEVSEQEFRKSAIDSVVLFESEMKSTGSEYRPRAFWQLDRAGSGSRRQT
jgi:RNA 2',3'-cyclic 3'-phosphodiesterase